MEADVDAVAARLIPDRDSQVVTYCTGPTRGNSLAVALRLQRLGYTKVRKYRDGIEDWVQARKQDRVGRRRLTVPAIRQQRVARHALGHPDPTIPPSRETSS